MLWRRAPDTISPAPTSLRMHTRCTCASGLHRQPCRQSMGMCEQCTRLARTNARTVARTMHAPCTVHIPHARDAHPARMCHACSSTVHREETLMMPTPVASSASALLPGVDVENMSETLVIFCEQRSQAALAQVCLEHNRGAWRCVVRGARCSGVVYRPTPLTRPTRARPRARTCAFRR